MSPIAFQWFLRTLLAVVALVWMLPLQAQQPVLEIITLKYRNADQVVPILTPLLEPGGTISGMQNRVIVRTSPQNLAELRQVLDTLDARPRRLLISVRHDAMAEQTRSEAEVSGSVQSGDVRATIPGTRGDAGGTVVLRRGDDRVKGRALDSRSLSENRALQTLQVVEGGEAWINVGQSVAVQGGGSTAYRETGSGFRVRPRVSGHNVTLEISTQRDSVADANAQNFDVQRVDTVVSGRLGEWIPLGGVMQESTRSDRGTLSRNTRTSSDNNRIFLKVEELRQGD